MTLALTKLITEESNTISLFIRNFNKKSAQV